MTELELEAVETQEEQDIALPRDYDEHFGVQGLNDEIKALLQQAVGIKVAEHLEAMEALKAEHRQKVEDLTQARETLIARVDVLEAELEELQSENERLNETSESFTMRIIDLEHERAEAFLKRDNAVRIAEEAQEAQKKAEAEAERLRVENESLKGQINELEGMVRTLKSATKPSLSGLKLTSTLPDISDEELKARKERERIEGINKLLERRGIAPLELPPLPSAEKAPESDDEPVTDEALAEQMQRVDEAAEADRETFPVVHTDAGADTAEAGAGEVVADAAEADRTPSSEELMTTLEQRMSALDRRITEIESWRKSVDYFRNNGRWPA